jgi:hypothetical protein
MIARIRLKGGRRVQKTTGKRQKVALAVAALLVPVCVVAWMLTLWRIGADLGITGGFGISSGILSHWQVWVGIASVLQVAVIALNRYGRSGR